MPPKMVFRISKKKKYKRKKTINNSTQPHNYNYLTDPSDSSSYDDDPFDDLLLPYTDYDDLANPHNLSYHHFIKQKHKPSFTFKVADDLDIFIREGGNAATQALLNLPLGIFLDILSTLSIKSLAVCRCVCKTWGTLIHHPHFSKLHHLKATQKLNNPFADTSLLFHVSESLVSEHMDDDDLVYNEIFLVEKDKDDNPENGVVLNPQFMPPTIQPKCMDFNFEVIGSCNGLVCLVEPYYCDLYVCNPVIGEYLALPSCHNNLASDEFAFGFGFDQIANEYKVVCILCNSSDLSCSTRMKAAVYTLGSDKWRSLGKFNFPHSAASSQVFVNGALHWMATTRNESQFIVAFDVRKEEFRNVSSPPIGGKSFKLLAELRGNLCVSTHSCDDWCRVWVMKEYGVKDSWAKEYVISRNVLDLIGVYLEPIKLMENGNILLLVDNRYLVYYNPRKKQFRKLKINLPPVFDVITHVSSLISLKDFVAPTDGSKHSINTGGWYGVMKSINSEVPEFDIRSWKWNEHMRQLWRKNHYIALS